MQLVLLLAVQDAATHSDCNRWPSTHRPRQPIAACPQVSAPADLLDASGCSTARLASLHAGSVPGLVALPGRRELASAGSDGTLRAFDAGWVVPAGCLAFC
jgi:hypothetical protein